MIKAVVGAGGKTSYIKKLAKEYVKKGLKVVVTTSTHMFVEEDTLLSDDAGEIIDRLYQTSYVMTGIQEGEKIRALSSDTYKNVCNAADVVLIEADGSKHMPLKYLGSNEPVIYDNVEEITVVCGLHSLGLHAKEAVHRLELVPDDWQILEDTIINAAHIQQFVMKGYVEPLREQYPDKKITIEPAKGSSLYERAVGALIKAEEDITLIQKEWFTPQPALIVCGGGHVSCELVKMASRLDFYTKVIDDREEFAAKERFPEADQVICDSFEHLEEHLEELGYYVVVTRGHKNDYDCVKKILDHSYEYLGMIGSKIKVAKGFEELRKAGIAEDKIASIFAPIGLDIKAVTPAEIAVSILAQIILEKNKKHTSSVSRQLLSVNEKGVLCVIIDKHGSSPRGIGSMMFVTETDVIDSIGGGVIEYVAISDARACDKVMVKDYHLDNEKSRELGMVCGGSNRVLFIPIEKV